MEYLIDCKTQRCTIAFATTATEQQELIVLTASISVYAVFGAGVQPMIFFVAYRLPYEELEEITVSISKPKFKKKVTGTCGGNPTKSKTTYQLHTPRSSRLNCKSSRRIFAALRETWRWIIWHYKTTKLFCQIIKSGLLPAGNFNRIAIRQPETKTDYAHKWNRPRDS